MPRSVSFTASDSDSGDEGGSCRADRYNALKLAWGLATWEHNTRAMRELQALFQVAYTSADKASQQGMYEDLLFAVEQAVRMGRLGRAVDQLAAAASRVLPKQKRNLLTTRMKQAAVQARRGKRGGGDDTQGSTTADEGEDGGLSPLTLQDLPLEVTEQVLSHLGPVELARCACACRFWRRIVCGAEAVWAELLTLTFPKPRRRTAGAAATVAQRSTTLPAYTAFSTAAAAQPRALLRWSGRVLCPSGPAWVASRDLRHERGVGSARFPREAQVVAWACRRSIASSSGDASDSDDDSSSSSNEEGALATRLRL